MILEGFDSGATPEQERARKAHDTTAFDDLDQNTVNKSELNQTDVGLLAVANPTTRFKNAKRENANFSMNLIPMKSKKADKINVRGSKPVVSRNEKD